MGSHLVSEILVLLFLLRLESVPPLSQDLADGSVVLVRVGLVHQGAVALREDHERVHWPPDHRLSLRGRGTA